jgi:hypothetical protein
MRTTSWVLTLACALLGAACASDDGAREPQRDDAGAPASARQGEDTSASTPAAAAADNIWVMRTDEFSLAPNQERFLCFTTTIEDDMVIGGYSSRPQPFVHHIVFVRTLAPEPEGFSECDTLFRMTWDPLYLTGAGASELKFPSDAGHKLSKGTQLLVQLHLLNTSASEVHGTVAIDLHRSTSQDVRPVSTRVFGTRAIKLPPKQESEVQGECELKDDIQLIAAFPHMHTLGRRLRFEVGPSAEAMQTVFTRDPYDFDDQHMENLELELSAGDHARVTCTYENTRSEEVGFGESTNQEMCFFVGFALDQSTIQSCMPSRQGPAPADG